jgi:hypothetical protein
LTVPLSPSDHAALHAALRAAGLDFPAPGDDLLDFWRQRSGFTLRLLGRQGASAVFAPRAQVELAAVIDGAA